MRRFTNPSFKAKNCGLQVFLIFKIIYEYWFDITSQQKYERGLIVVLHNSQILIFSIVRLLLKKKGKKLITIAM